MAVAMRDSKNGVEGYSIGYCALLWNQSFLALDHVLGNVDIVIDGQQYKAECKLDPVVVKSKSQQGGGPSDRIHIMSVQDKVSAYQGKGGSISLGEKVGGAFSYRSLL